MTTPRIIKLKEVMNLTSLSRASIYRYLKENTFPSQIKIGVRSVGWKESEILDWIELRPTVKN